MTREIPWEPSNPIEVSPVEYEKQVVSWLRAAEGQLKNFSVQHLETLPGSAGEFVIDAVARFKVFGGAEIAVLVECKKLKRSVERDVVMILKSKMQETGSHKGIIFSTSGFQRGAIDEPPQLNWSTPMFRKRRTKNGKQATEARRDCLEVAAG